MGGVLALIAYLLDKSQKDTAAIEANLQEQTVAEEDRNTESEELDWSHIEPVDPVGLEIGYGLIPLIDQDTGTLLSRVRGIRKKLSSEIGF